MPTSNEPEVRRSRLSDPDLVADATKQLIALRRDATALASDGVTIAAFDALPSDIVDQQTQAAETATKNGAVAALQVALRGVAGPVADAYGATSPHYKRLNVLDLQDKTDAELLRAATDCHVSGTTFLADAACVREGLSQARLDAIPVARQKLVDTLKAQADAVMTRALSAQARVRQHNALYDEYARFNEKGQRRFKTDPARYDDYVGRADSPPKPPVPPAM
jgi:hypothetical protein